MNKQATLDTDGNALKLGALYSCIINTRHGHTEHGRLVRYCGKDLQGGHPLFADANTWNECLISGDGLMLQLAPAIDPTTEGWAKLPE